MAINVPEIILLSSLKAVLKKIREDYNSNIVDPTQSLLYRLLNGVGVQRYDLFTQAVSVLITKEDNPRHLDINLFFNAKREGMPTLHITLPGENERNNDLGQSWGSHDPIYSVDGTTYLETYNRRFSAKYSLIITSDNSNEIILLYHFFRSVLISLTAHLNLSNLENIKLSGGDIQINSDLIPVNIFVRSIGVDFEYDVEGIELFNHLALPFDIIVDSIPTVIK